MKKSSPRLVDLVRGYYVSPQFRSLNTDTQYVRRLVLDKLLQEPIGPANPNIVATLPALVTSQVIRKLRDRRIEKPEAANTLLKALRAVYKWGVEYDFVPTNPARDVRYINVKTDGHHTWTDDEVAAYEAHWPIGTAQRIALAVLLYTGLRRGDAVTVGWGMVKDDWLCVRMQKTGDIVELPVLEDLKQILAIGPVGKDTWIAGERGAPLQADSFGNMFRAWCDAAELHGCSAHGLRKAAACRLAEAGATEQQLMAIFGWQTSKEAVLYTRAANKRNMARQVAHLLNRNQVASKPPKNAT